MIAFITCNSNLVPVLDGLSSSNPCRFEFSVFFDFLLGIMSLAAASAELAGSKCKQTLGGRCSN